MKVQVVRLALDLLFLPLFQRLDDRVTLAAHIFQQRRVLQDQVYAILRVALADPCQHAEHRTFMDLINAFFRAAVRFSEHFFDLRQDLIPIKDAADLLADRRQQLAALFAARLIVQLRQVRLTGEQSADLLAAVSVSARLEEFHLSGRAVDDDHVPDRFEEDHCIHIAVYRDLHTVMREIDPARDLKAQIIDGQFKPAVRIVTFDIFILRLDLLILVDADRDQRVAFFDVAVRDTDRFQL